MMQWVQSALMLAIFALLCVVIEELVAIYDLVHLIVLRTAH